MHIAVCIKQVPNTEARLRLAKDGRWIDEDDVSFAINDSDNYALEEALRLAEKTGGEVVVLSLGPARVKEALRKALALGATKAVHLEDAAFQGGDAPATARALAAAIRREDVGLVLTGAQSDDAGFGSTGSILAGHLGWPHAWLVMGVELENATSAKLTREMESGMNEIFRLRLPAVIEIQAGINHPRYASLKGIMQAKKKPVDVKTAADLGVADAVGAGAAKAKINKIYVPAKGDSAEILTGSTDEIVSKLVGKIKELGLL